MAVDESRWAEIANSLEKRYEGTILRGDEIDTPDRIPTGSLELDYITGGGIPIGRWTRCYGGFSSTKTRTCFGIMAEAQELGLSVAYYNVEKQYTREAAERCGVDTSALTVIEGSTIEEIGEKLEAMLAVVNVHIIDSCSNAVAIDELDADLTEWRPGLMARAWGKVFRRAHERFDSTDNTVILIDQMRTTFGGRGKQAGEEPPGGRFMNFISSMNLNFTRGKWLFYDKHGHLSEKGDPSKSLSGSQEPDGREIRVRCEKSRVGRPELTANLAFDLNQYMFDYDYEYVRAAKHLGLVTNKGAWWTYVDPETGKSPDKATRGQGDAGVRKIIEEEDLAQYIYDTVLAGNNWRPTEQTE